MSSSVKLRLAGRQPSTRGGVLRVMTRRPAESRWVASAACNAGLVDAKERPLCVILECALPADTRRLLLTVAVQPGRAAPRRRLPPCAVTTRPRCVVASLRQSPGARIRRTSTPRRTRLSDCCGARVHRRSLFCAASCTRHLVRNRDCMKSGRHNYDDVADRFVRRRGCRGN